MKKVKIKSLPKVPNNPCPLGQVPDGQGGCTDDLTTAPIPTSNLYDYYIKYLNEFKAGKYDNPEKWAGKLIRQKRKCTKDGCSIEKWEEEPPKKTNTPNLNDGYYIERSGEYGNPGVAHIYKANLKDPTNPHNRDYLGAVLADEWLSGDTLENFYRSGYQYREPIDYEALKDGRRVWKAGTENPDELEPYAILDQRAKEPAERGARELYKKRMQEISDMQLGDPETESRRQQYVKEKLGMLNNFIDNLNDPRRRGRHYSGPSFKDGGSLPKAQDKGKVKKGKTFFGRPYQVVNMDAGPDLWGNERPGEKTRVKTIYYKNGNVAKQIIENNEHGVDEVTWHDKDGNVVAEETAGGYRTFSNGYFQAENNVDYEKVKRIKDEIEYISYKNKLDGFLKLAKLNLENMSKEGSQPGDSFNTVWPDWENDRFNYTRTKNPEIKKSHAKFEYGGYIPKAQLLGQLNYKPSLGLKLNANPYQNAFKPKVQYDPPASALEFFHQIGEKVRDERKKEILESGKKLKGLPGNPFSQEEADAIKAAEEKARKDAYWKQWEETAYGRVEPTMGPIDAAIGLVASIPAMATTLGTELLGTGVTLGNIVNPLFAAQGVYNFANPESDFRQALSRYNQGEGHWGDVAFWGGLNALNFLGAKSLPGDIKASPLLRNAGKSVITRTGEVKNILFEPKLTTNQASLYNREKTESLLKSLFEGKRQGWDEQYWYKQALKKRNVLKELPEYKNALEEFQLANHELNEARLSNISSYSMADKSNAFKKDLKPYLKRYNDAKDKITNIRRGAFDDVRHQYTQRVLNKYGFPLDSRSIDNAASGYFGKVLPIVGDDSKLLKIGNTMPWETQADFDLLNSIGKSAQNPSLGFPVKSHIFPNIDAQVSKMRTPGIGVHILNKVSGEPLMKYMQGPDGLKNLKTILTPEAYNTAMQNLKFLQDNNVAVDWVNPNNFMINPKTGEIGIVDLSILPKEAFTSPYDFSGVRAVSKFGVDYPALFDKAMGAFTGKYTKGASPSLQRYQRHIDQLMKNAPAYSFPSEAKASGRIWGNFDLTNPQWEINPNNINPGGFRKGGRKKSEAGFKILTDTNGKYVFVNT